MSEMNPPAIVTSQYSARDLSPNSLRIKSKSRSPHDRSRSPHEQPVPAIKPSGTSHHASATSSGPYLNTQSFENVSVIGARSFIDISLLTKNELILIIAFMFFIIDPKDGSADLDIDFAGDFPTKLDCARLGPFPKDPQKLSILQRGFRGDHQPIRIPANTWLPEGGSERPVGPRLPDLYLSLGDSGRR